MFLNDLLLNANGFGRQPFGRRHQPFVSSSAMEHANGKGRARTHSGAGRQVAVTLNSPACLNLRPLQHGTNGRMPDLIDCLRQFNLRINNPMPVFEERWQCPNADVAILIDGRSQNGSPVLAKPAWVVGATTEKGNSKRCPTDNHKERISLDLTGLLLTWDRVIDAGA